MTETKFISLRKRLDQLGYKQPLSVDSLPLVEKVFGDLLHTTESLKKAKLQLSKHTEQKVREFLLTRLRCYCFVLISLLRYHNTPKVQLSF